MQGLRPVRRRLSQARARAGRSVVNVLGYHPVQLTDAGHCTSCASARGSARTPRSRSTRPTSEAGRLIRPPPGADEGQRGHGRGGHRRPAATPTSATRSRPRPSCSSGWRGACPSWGEASSRPRASSARSTWPSAPRATGARVLVVQLGPGISLMAEGMSYMAGSEVAVVLVNVMRGGPGLGSIGPSQSDYFQATKGHGHGDYRVPVLAPASIAEAIELVADAFELAERYRTPVMILADGVIGQAMEPVVPSYREPRAPRDGWAADRRRTGRQPRVRALAAPAARGARGAQPTISRPSTRRSRATRSASRPSSSTTPRSRSSPTARPPGSRARRRTRAGARACASASSGRSACGLSPRSALGRRGAGQAGGRRGRAVGGPDGRGRAPGLSRAPCRSSSTAEPAAWCRRRARWSTRCAAPGRRVRRRHKRRRPMTHPDARPAARHLPAPRLADRPLDPLLPGLRARHHPPADRRGHRRARPRAAHDRRRPVGCTVFAYDYFKRRLRRVAPRPGAGGGHRRPARTTGRVRVHLPGRWRPGGDRHGRDRPRRGARRAHHRRLRQQRHLRHDRRPDGADHAARPAHDLEPHRP